MQYMENHIPPKHNKEFKNFVLKLLCFDSRDKIFNNDGSVGLVCILVNLVASGNDLLR